MSETDDYSYTHHPLLDGYQRRRRTDQRRTKALEMARWPNIDIGSTQWEDYKIGKIIPLLEVGAPLYVVANKLLNAMSTRLSRHLHVSKVKRTDLEAVLAALDDVFREAQYEDQLASLARDELVRMSRKTRERAADFVKRIMLIAAQAHPSEPMERLQVIKVRALLAGVN